MDEYKAKFVGMARSYTNGKPILQFEVEECEALNECTDRYFDKNLKLRITKENNDLRSLDANALFWANLHKLSAKVGIDPVAIYRDYVQCIGDNCDIVCVKEIAVNSLIEKWEDREHRIGRVAVPFECKIEGCVNVALYESSSHFSKEQMWRLNNMCIRDCEEQGIPTDIEEIKRAVKQW